MTDNITIPRATVQQALDALERALETSMRQALKARIPECGEFAGIAQDVDWAATALLAALEQQQAKPVAWHYTNKAGVSVLHCEPSARLDADMEAARDCPDAHKVTPLYTAPPQRKPLTKEQCLVIVATAINGHASTREAILWAIEYVERHHGIKENT